MNPLLDTSTFSNTEKKDVWFQLKSFFSTQSTLIILAILCVTLFLVILCLALIITRLLKKRKAERSKTTYPHRTFPSSPKQTGLTSNQIPVSAQNLSPATADSKATSSFDSFQEESKHVWNEKVAPSSTNDDDVETVNEVLAMEERDGKIYYRVNFTGHSPDYTAWVCEEDLIPE